MKTPPSIQKKIYSNSAEYYVYINDEQLGPFNYEKIKVLIELKNIDENTSIWREGIEDWIKITNLDEFSKYFTPINSLNTEKAENQKSVLKEKNNLNNNSKMKVLSIIGIILSIAGIVLSISNWVVFTLQMSNFNYETLSDGSSVIKDADFGHHEHSITLLIILCALFVFFLFCSIFSLNNYFSKKESSLLSN